MSADERRALWRHMREPVATFAALVLLLAANVAIGWLHPFAAVWILETAIMVVMIAVVLLFSMEVIGEPALIRFFAVVGFVWVGILFTMTLIDYLGR